MASSVLHLIETLEAHLEQKNAELKALREENSVLKQRLVAQLRHLQPSESSVESSLAPSSAPPASCSASVAETDANHVEQPCEDEVREPSPELGALNEEAPLPPSPQALLNQWYQRYPKAFFTGHTKPLKVGIHHDLAQREPWSGKLIRRALANYVNLPRYVKSMRDGAERIDLEGHPAGKVDKEAARHASERRKDKSVSDAGGQGAPKSSRSKKASSKQPLRTANQTPAPPQMKAFQVPVETPEQANASETPQKSKPISLEDKLKGLQEKFSAR